MIDAEVSMNMPMTKSAAPTPRRKSAGVFSQTTRRAPILQLGLLLRHLLLGPFAGSDVGISEHQFIVGDRGVSDIEDLS
jgi:hypothetical protein